MFNDDDRIVEFDQIVSTFKFIPQAEADEREGLLAEHYRVNRNATRWQHMNSIAAAIYSYAMEHNGDFPDCLTETAVDVTTCIDIISEKYMVAFPTPPQAPDETYMIQKEGERIKITSTAQEAIEDEVEFVR